jgi:hypothetical protein
MNGEAEPIDGHRAAVAFGQLANLDHVLRLSWEYRRSSGCPAGPQTASGRRLDFSARPEPHGAAARPSGE